ncbi:MAG: hypothetical protein JW801_18140 [Bacteroidales bacterium]|nr:hypothetical protein [Bacteroidales bacterium]
MDRKNFFKAACISGACLCGFSSIALSANTNTPAADEPENKPLELVHSWTAALLANMSSGLDEEEKRKVLKSCALVHYQNLNMDEVLAPFAGDLEKFIVYLEENWGWKVDYDPATKTLLANENKNFCVCPMINTKYAGDKSALCYCSEGFAEKMFSVVAGVPASATVASSIHRGDEVCVYRVVFGG